MSRRVPYRAPAPAPHHALVASTHDTAASRGFSRFSRPVKTESAHTSSLNAENHDPPVPFHTDVPAPVAYQIIHRPFHFKRRVSVAPTIVTRKSLYSSLSDLFARAAPFVQDYMTQSWVHWRNVLSRYEPLVTKFLGPSSLEAVAKLLMTLAVWANQDAQAQHANRLHTKSSMIVHPWILIIKGAHGMGKSSLVAFVLNHLLNNIVYDEVDKSFEVRSKMIELVQSLVTTKASHPDTVKLTLLENAEVIADTSSLPQLIELVNATTALIANGHPVAGRLIIVTSSFYSPWMRSLRDSCHASVIHLEPIAQATLSMYPRWASRLKDVEGIPGRAILADYVDSLATGSLARTQDALVSDLFKTAHQLLDPSALTETWWDWVETQLSVQVRVVFQLEWNVLVHGTNTSYKTLFFLLSSRRYFASNPLRAFTLRTALKALTSRPSLEEYDKEFSWQVAQQIKEAQAKRFAYSSGKICTV